MSFIRFMARTAETAHAGDVDIVLVQRIAYAIDSNLVAADIRLEVAVIIVVMRVVTVQTLMYLVAGEIRGVERARGQVDVVVQGIGRG